MTYPLEAGDLDYYPVRVGSALITMVDPHPGYEKAYNRWYERDHFYDGCMVGPWMYAGSRWVAPRWLKDLRWPTDDETVARPPTAGSYVSIYWVEEGHHKEHFDDWAGPNVRGLYANGRGFAERRRFAVQNLVQHDVVIFTAVGRESGEHLVEHHADGVDVDPVIEVRCAARLFGSHVLWSSQDAAGRRQSHR